MKWLGKLPKRWGYVAIVLIVLISVTACPAPRYLWDGSGVLDGTATVDDLPAYSDQSFIILSGNAPRFTEADMTPLSYEQYSPLDALGRCGPAEACIGKDLMPTEERESISHIYPSGWDNNPYEFIDGQYVYNRCHLIGFQLTGENDNERNLITGTRYMNTEGMLPFENMVADYIKETGNHVLYRVTPIYDGDCLVASGVQMEGYSVEDGGEGVCFHVYCYNVQPGVVIDYETGENHAEGRTTSSALVDEAGDFVVNTSSKKIHRPDCASVETILAKNRLDFSGALAELIADGYEPCGACLSE